MTSAWILNPGQRVLLGLLFVMAVSGCKGDGLSDYERARKKQTDAIAALENAGGKVVEVHYPQGDAWTAKLPGAQVTDETFAHLEALGRLTELDLSKSTITDAQMPKLNELGKLFRKLDLSHTAVSDAGLDALTDLPVLADLYLTGSKVTAVGVQRFLQARRSNPKVLTKNPKIHQR